MRTVGWEPVTGEAHAKLEFNFQNRLHIERGVAEVMAHVPRAQASRVRAILSDLVEAVRPKPVIDNQTIYLPDEEDER